MSTIFERILSGEIPSARVYEDEYVFAFMDAGQVNPGHVLIATRKPYVTLMDADEESVVAMMRAAHRIARAVQEAFRPDGITILQANKPAGWQTVPHLHLHVLPRYDNDGVDLTWPRKEPGMEKLREYAALIRLDDRQA
jgi:histidine triad (HIT) family protein